MKDMEEYKKYWEDRSARQGELTVGHNSWNNEEFIAKQKEWINRFEPYWATLKRDGNTLDFGCGSGRLTKHLPGKVYGLDMTKNLIDIAKENDPDSNYIHYDGKTLPFEDEYFDSVWTCTVLQHIVLPEHFVEITKQLGRKVKKGGKLLMFENAALIPNKIHITFRNLNEYQNAFRDFEIELINTYVEVHEPHNLMIGTKIK